MREVGRGPKGLMALTLGKSGEQIFAVKRGRIDGFVRVKMVEMAVIRVVE